MGISARDLLRADPVEFVLLQAAAVEAADYLRDRDAALARLVINDLAEATKK